jgi:hypothetical protein
LQNIIGHSRFVAEPPYAPLHIGHRFEGRDFDRSALSKEQASSERFDQFRGAATASIMNDTLDAMTILSGPVKPEYSAPLVQHEQYAVAEIERIEKIVSMSGVAIAIRSRGAELL